jgi:hypothetical protein
MRAELHHGRQSFLMLAARWAVGVMLACLFTASGASAPAIEDNAVLVWNEEALNATRLARTALAQYHDARSGLCWAVSAEGAASLPWRPLALPSPIRAESLALAIGVDSDPRQQLRRALRHTIEFDPLPPAEILIALTRDAESAP